MIEFMAAIATAHDIARGLGYYLLACVPGSLFALALLRGGHAA